ncbi:MAG: flagellar basal body-associated protein FliL [Acidimicrobiia bacterium]
MAKKKKKDEAAEGEAGADEAPKAKSGKAKTMLFGALLVVGGAMGQKFFLSAPPAQVIIAPPVDGGVETASAAHGVDCSAVGTGASGGEAAPHARRTSGGEAATGGTADLSSMTINLADGHYLKVGITLELGETIISEEFSAQTAKAADVVLNYFSTKAMDDLTNDKHAAIKVELTCLIDEAYAATAHAEEGEDPPQTVIGVLFREFLTS